MLTRLPCTAAMLACAAVITTPGSALAQPEPSFRVACGALRAAIAAFDRSADGLITIAVEGALQHVHFDGALAYLLVCAPPDPRVLCVTYSTGDRKAGDRVIVTGNFSQPDADHVLLDPCLHSPPEE